MCSITKLPAKLDYKNTPSQHSTNPQKEKKRKKRADALCKAMFSLHFNENTILYPSIPHQIIFSSTNLSYIYDYRTTNLFPFLSRISKDFETVDHYQARRVAHRRHT